MTTAAIAAGASAAAPRRFFAERPLGLQIYTLGDGAGRDIDATFARVAAMGYREIELPSLLGHSPKDLRAAADRAGLAIPSVHIPLTRMTPGMGAALSFASDPHAIAEALGTIGARTAIAPLFLLPDGFRPQSGETFQAAIGRVASAPGGDIWKMTAALLNARAAALKPVGIATGYHNHNPEFAPVGETTGFAILKREFDPALVRFEVDLGWVAAAGHDPVAFLATLHGRVSHVHVKDVARGTVPNFALRMNPTEVGSGTLDWRRILPAALAAGARHFYVEQEPPFAIPREDAARKSAAFLATV